ncbi:MAG: 4Fe-4S dicluster domain-containing protein, partial [Desulfobacterales bacterium]
MVEGTLFMLGLGALCAIVLGAASRIFYVWEDPRISQVEACFAGANCGGCGYAGCSAAAVAVVAGNAPPSVCVVGGMESAQGAAAVMGMEVGTAEPLKSYNTCTGGNRAENKFVYLGVNTCSAQAAISGGQRVCSVGCLGLGDCVRACMFGALKMGPEGYPVVDREKCVGCGVCEQICPKGVMNVTTASQRVLHFNQSDDRLA